MASTGEWGQRLATPDLTVATPLFFDATGQPIFDGSGAQLAPPPESNILPAEGEVFTHTLEKRDWLLVTAITRHPETLHPRAEHHLVHAAPFAGRTVLGNRIRFFHASRQPVMDLAGPDGQTPQGAHVKLVLDRTAFAHTYANRLPDLDSGKPLKKLVPGYVAPGFLYTVGLIQANIPPLPAEAKARFDAIARRTKVIHQQEQQPPRSRTKE